MMVFKSLRDRSLTYSPKLKGGSHFCFAFAFVPHGLDRFSEPNAGMDHIYFSHARKFATDVCMKRLMSSHFYFCLPRELQCPE